MTRPSEQTRRGRGVVETPEVVDGVLSSAWFYDQRDDDDLVHMKCEIPLAYWIRLHGLKILNNRSIQRSVHLALEAYFERHATSS